MRLTFDENIDNYLELKLNSSGNVVVILSAKDGSNHLNTIINSVEIEKDDFIKLINSLGLLN
jgi:phage terminase large subunit-like protein